MKIAKTIAASIVLLLMIDAAGFIFWLTSGQHPVDNFFIGTITTHILKIVL